MTRNTEPRITDYALRITFLRWEVGLNSPRALAAYYFCYFAAVGISEPYLTPFWRSLGFSPAELGALSAIAPAVGAVAPFAWTALADLTRRGERIFRVNSWLAAALALLLPRLDQFPLVAVAVLFLSLFRVSLIPLANSMTFRVLAGRRDRYAGIRVWGTLGYIVVAVAAGAWADRRGLRSTLYGIALATALSGLVALLGGGREDARLPRVRWAGIHSLLRGREVRLLLLTTCLAWTAYGPYATFYTIHLEHLGRSGTFAGAAWALAAGSELCVMLTWSRLCRFFRLRTWLALAMAVGTLRWGLSALASQPVTLLALQLTHAFTFGIFYLAAVQTVDTLAPDTLRATAQGLLASVTFGLGGLLGSLLGGVLYGRLGMAWCYASAALLSAVAAGLYWAKAGAAEALSGAGATAMVGGGSG